jgi:hypothetical protein
MCATSHHFGDPQSPRYAQLDWMGGGLMSRQMMHAPASVAMSGQRQGRRRDRAGAGANWEINCFDLANGAHDWGRAPLMTHAMPQKDPPPRPASVTRARTQSHAQRSEAWGRHGALSCNLRRCCFAAVSDNRSGVVRTAVGVRCSG